MKIVFNGVEIPELRKFSVLNSCELCLYFNHNTKITEEELQNLLSNVGGEYNYHYKDERCGTDALVVIPNGATIEVSSRWEDLE
jgi:hypothetical protein